MLKLDIIFYRQYKQYNSRMIYLTKANVNPVSSSLSGLPWFK